MSLTTNVNARHCAVVIGVGASQGIGAAVCRRFAKEGLLVYVVGRTASKLQLVVDEIKQQGGQAVAHVLDASSEAAISQLFQTIGQQDQIIDAVIHNVGGNVPSRFLSTSLNFFNSMWRFTFAAGFLVGQQAAAMMREQGHGSIIFTGASASMRGKPFFAAFTMGKAALRTYALGLAQELAPQHVHVAHVVVDGMVDGDRVNQAVYGLGRLVRQTRGTGGLNVDAIADNYWMLHRQHEAVWTHEIDLRPYREKF